MSSPGSPPDYAAGYAKALRRANLPPEDKLRQYADQLPDIYRDVLAAFQSAGPGRSSGDSVAFGTIRNHLLNERRAYTEAQLEVALANLVDAGFLDEPDFMQAFAPTPVGEELIAVLTGRRAAPPAVPELPKPTW